MICFCRWPAGTMCRTRWRRSAVARELGVTDDGIRKGLKKFAGVKRRFTTTGIWNEVRIVDDYGHHPVEIAAVLSAPRAR